MIHKATKEELLFLYPAYDDTIKIFELTQMLEALDCEQQRQLEFIRCVKATVRNECGLHETIGQFNYQAQQVFNQFKRHSDITKQAMSERAAEKPCCRIS